MLKKQHIFLMTLIAVVLTFIMVFYQPVDQQNISEINPPVKSTEKNEKITQNSDDSYTYNGEYFSVTYPENWYTYGLGRHVYLELLTIHSISLEDLKSDESQKFSSITIDVMNPENNIDEFVNIRNTIMVDGTKSYILREIDDKNFYGKTIILERDKMIYKISLESRTDSPVNFETIKTRDLKVLDSVLDSFRFK